MMKRKTAAEYCDMSEAAFEREIIAGRLPAGIMFGGREHWRKDALDAAFARLSGDTVPDYRRRLRGDYGQAA
jgi:LPS sulfotransferase NodH